MFIYKYDETSLIIYYYTGSEKIRRVHTTDFRPGLTYGPRPGTEIEHAM